MIAAILWRVPKEVILLTFTFKIDRFYFFLKFSYSFTERTIIDFNIIRREFILSSAYPHFGFILPLGRRRHSLHAIMLFVFMAAIFLDADVVLEPVADQLDDRLFLFVGMKLLHWADQWLEPILHHMFCSGIPQSLGHMRPFFPMLQNIAHQNFVLLNCPSRADLRRVEVVQPSFPTLFSSPEEAMLRPHEKLFCDIIPFFWSLWAESTHCYSMISASISTSYADHLLILFSLRTMHMAWNSKFFGSRFPKISLKNSQSNGS